MRHGADRLLEVLLTSASETDVDEAFVDQTTRPQEALRSLLEDLSLDDATFYGYYLATRGQLVEAVDALVQGASSAIGPLTACVYLFAHSIEISSRFGRSGAPPSDAELTRLRTVAARASSLPSLIQRIYNVAPPKRRPREDDSWDPLVWRTLRFHRLGTSSVVFQIEGRSGRKYVLKLSHVLFHSVGPVAAATTAYFDTWGALSISCPNVVRVRASGQGWILEDYVHGWTLREIFEGTVPDVTAPTGAAAIAKVFAPTLQAVRSLHEASGGRGHGDLSPSNIIVLAEAGLVGEAPWPVRLIDMGPNLLASETVGRVTAAEARFVAPEVRRDYPRVRDVDAAADVFSLGHLLAYCAGYTGTDGFFRFDERIFAERPDLAELAARLVASDPVQRAAALEHGDIDNLPRHAVAVARLSEVVDPAPLNRSDGLIVRSLLGSWGAVVGAIRQLVRVMESRGANYRETAPPMRTCVAGLAFAIAAFIMIYSAAIELSADPFGLGGFFRTLGFNEQTVGRNWEVRSVGGSFLVACFQYNVRAFGGVTLIGTTVSRRLKALSESALWALTVVVLGCVVVCTFVNPRLWIVASACGVALVAGNNYIHSRTRRAIRDEFGLNVPRRLDRLQPATASTLEWVGSSRILQRGYKDILDYWTPTCLTYAAVVAFLGVLSLVHLIHDWTTWAVALTVVNLVVFSYSQATKQGPDLRVDLQQHLILSAVARPSMEGSTTRK